MRVAASRGRAGVAGVTGVAGVAGAASLVEVRTGQQGYAPEGGTESPFPAAHRAARACDWATMATLRRSDAEAHANEPTAATPAAAGATQAADTQRSADEIPFRLLHFRAGRDRRMAGPAVAAALPVAARGTGAAAAGDARDCDAARGPGDGGVHPGVLCGGGRCAVPRRRRSRRGADRAHPGLWRGPDPLAGVQRGARRHLRQRGGARNPHHRAGGVPPPPRAVAAVSPRAPDRDGCRRRSTVARGRSRSCCASACSRSSPPRSSSSSCSSSCGTCSTRSSRSPRWRRWSSTSPTPSR